MEELVLAPTQGMVTAEGQGANAGSAMPLGLLDQLRRLPATFKASPRARPAMLFGIGLLVGWVVMGWLLFPIRWTNTDPWDMRGSHQERYVLMLAEYYWQTEDLGFVLESINGWDRAKLDKLTTSLMNDQDSTAAQRAQLAALGDALRLPLQQRSLLASLFGNSAGLLVAVVLAMVPLLGGLGLVIALGLRQVRAPSVDQELAQLEEELAMAAGGRALAKDAIWDEKGEQEEEEAEGEEEKDTGSGLAAMAAETSGVDEEISNMLSTFFDDDDTSLESLQSLTKGLPDLNIDYMLKTMKGMVQLFRWMPPKA